MRITLNLPANGKRLIYDLAAFDLPEVPYLAAQNLPSTALALPTHLHKKRMEISHIIKGERVYRVAGKDYHLNGNQVFVTWPDEIHGSGSFLHGRGLHFWIQLVLPKPGAPFLGLKAARAKPLLEALWSLPLRHFLATPEMHGIFSRILHLCRQGPSPLNKVRMSALTAEWLMEVVAGADNPIESAVTRDIAMAKRKLEENPLAMYSVAELADAAHLSESHFKRKFRGQLGMPPGEYLQRRRLEVAVKLLAGGKSVTVIAYTLGFSSSQHFSTTFKKYFGISPQSWRDRQRSDGDFELDRELGIVMEKDRDGLRPWVDEEGRLHGHICETAINNL